MAIDDRLKSLRSKLGLNQTQFGKEIGLKQTIIGQMENGTRDITERTILAICRAYCVSEEWMRDGKGDMFNSGSDSTIDRFAAAKGMNELEKTVLRAYLSLPAASRSVLLDAARHMANAISAAPDEEDAELAESIQFEKHLSGVDAEEKQA